MILSTTANHCAKDIRISTIVLAERKLRDVQRHVDRGGWEWRSGGLWGSV
jgi:hypothetical protein